MSLAPKRVSNSMGYQSPVLYTCDEPQRYILRVPVQLHEKIIVFVQFDEDFHKTKDMNKSAFALPCYQFLV